MRLMTDNMMLEQLYEKNKEYFQALNIYIAAGEIKLEELQTKTIPELKTKSGSKPRSNGFSRCK